MDKVVGTVAIVTSELGQLTPEEGDRELRAVIREMLAEWSDLSSIDARRKGFDAARTATVYGYAAHCHRLAPVALDLLEQGKVIEAHPLVRVIYETAIHAQWIVQVPDALDAALYEEWRNRKNLLDTLSTARMFKHRDFDAIDRLEQWGHESKRGLPRAFVQICDDLTPAGPDAYANYSIFSSVCHPSLLLANYYLTPGTDDVPFQLRPEPEQPPAILCMYFVAASLIWSGRALDFMDKRRLRRNALRARANRLGIPDKFDLSADAWLRQQ